MNILEMRNITKIYSNGVIANKDVSFSVEEGEIHALMGENGAGKSTLMKVLFGLENPDEGAIFFKGQKVDISNPKVALDLGIGMVSQHFMLIEELKVYENIILGIEPKKGVFIDENKAKLMVLEYGQKYGLQVDPNAVVSDLSVSQKQKIEILKVLCRGSKLIILDEPTAVLTPQETEELFKQLLLLKQSGYTIVIINHKIKEVKQLCDRITILRKGRSIDTVESRELTSEEISKLMVGRDVVLRIDKQPLDKGEKILEVDKVNLLGGDGNRVLNNINMSLYRNQIVGIAGVDGNGQNELAESIFGIRKVLDGSIKFEDKIINKLSIKERRDLGISYIPEDRIERGVSSQLSIWHNLIADKVIGNLNMVDFKDINSGTNKLIKDYEILAISNNQTLAMLSGGNMQKVVVARELSSQPSLLIANQPTRGIDVGAQEFIWRQLIKFRDDGNSIMLITADLNELLELSDVILVMLNGEIVAEFENTEDLTEKTLGLYMLGVKKQEARKVSHEEKL